MTRINRDTAHKLEFNGLLTVQRSGQYLLYSRRIGIYIDNKKAGAIRRGETKSFPLEAGQHHVFAQIDWLITPPISLVLAPGENKMLYLGIGYTGWKFFSTLLFLFRNPTDLIYLSDERPDDNSGS
jgi:hypothetical protein